MLCWVLNLPKRDHGGYRLYRSAPTALTVITETIQSLDPNSRFPKVHERRLGVHPGLSDIAHRSFDPAFEVDVEALLGHIIKGYKTEGVYN